MHALLCFFQGGGTRGQLAIMAAMDFLLHLRLCTFPLLCCPLKCMHRMISEHLPAPTILANRQLFTVGFFLQFTNFSLLALLHNQKFWNIMLATLAIRRDKRKAVFSTQVPVRSLVPVHDVNSCTITPDIYRNVLQYILDSCKPKFFGYN